MCPIAAVYNVNERSLRVRTQRLDEGGITGEERRVMVTWEYPRNVRQFAVKTESGYRDGEEREREREREATSRSGAIADRIDGDCGMRRGGKRQ